MNFSVKNNAVTFGAGIPSGLKSELRFVNPAEIEKSISEEFGVDCKLSGNKTLAIGMLYALKLLREAAVKFDLPFLETVPPAIRVYSPTELVKQGNDSRFGFCIGEIAKVLKKEPDFECGSVFIKNIKDNLNKWDAQVDEWYKKHIISSDYFLAPFFHEFLHNIHISKIYKTSPIYGYGYARNLANDTFSHVENRLIADKIGSYAKISKMELFAETLSKMISESVEEDSLKIVSNPMDKLKEFPQFVQEFINKELM